MSTTKENNVFALPKSNFKIIVAGIALVLLGFILMSGGAAKDPNTFNYEEIFSPVRITIAPIVCLLGYIIVAIGILRNPSESSK